MTTSFRIAWKTRRGARSHARFFAAAVWLGVVVLVAVAATANYLEQAVNHHARTLLAADLQLRATAPFPSFVKKHLQAPGRVFAESLEFPAMARLPGSNRSLLIEVKAVAANHPLRGQVILSHGGALSDALANQGAVWEKNGLTRLSLAVGGLFSLGEATFRISDTLEQEPDRVTHPFRWGPRVMIPLERAEKTGLLRFGSRIKHVVSVRLAPGENPESIAKSIQNRAQLQGIRVFSPTNSQRSIRRFMRRFTLFIGLTAMLTLLAGGLAMAGAMGAHLRENRRTVAILKGLGADNSRIRHIFLWQMLFLALPGALLGAAAGIAFPWLLLRLAGNLFATPFPYMPNPLLAFGGALFGVTVAAASALGPLWWTRRVSPALLFRASGWGSVVETPLKTAWATTIPIIIIPAALISIRAGELKMGALFAVGLTGSLGLVAITAAGGLALLRRLALPTIHWRLAAHALVRRSGGTLTVVMALGLGLGVVIALLLLEQNLDHQIAGPLARRAPSFFFIDIQPNQTAPFRETIVPFVKKEGDLQMIPVIRGRLTQLKEKAIQPDQMTGHPESWRLTREYVLTQSETLPPGNRLSAGRWWDNPNAKEASLEANMAKNLGLAIGDTLTFDIQGIPVSAPITNLRDVRWSDLGLNFFVVFSPAVLKGAPLTHIATVATTPKREEALLAQVTHRFNNITALAVREVMETLQALFKRLANAVRLVAITAVIAGLLVLGVNIAASRRRRSREAAICRLLGATRRHLMHTAAAEFLMLGIVASTAGVAVGQAITALVIKVILDDPWIACPGLTGVAFGMGVLVILVVGLAGSYQELGRPVMQVLRENG